MDLKKIRVDRHSQFWEAGQKRLRRTILGGLIFAVVVLFKVLEPYAETANSRLALDDLEMDKQQVDEELKTIDAVQKELKEIAATVGRAPWNQHMEELKRRFREGQVGEPQREADETIEAVASEARERLLGPLEEVVARAPDSWDLGSHPEQMNNAIDDWKQEYIGKAWFRTVDQKTETLYELDTRVETIQEQASRTVETLQDQVKQKQAPLKQRQEEIAAEIKSERAGIQKALDGSIPVWARGLVTVELMVRIYPLILIGIAVYLVGTAWVASQHFHAMADARGWSAEARSEPVLSSLWTLTYRGPVGTAITIVCYAGVLLGLWFCLVRGVNAAGTGSVPASVGWFPHLIMGLAFVTAVGTPLRRRSDHSSAEAPGQSS